jgi:hypothetical protein
MSRPCSEAWKTDFIMSDIHIGLCECQIEYDNGRTAAGIEVVFRDELKTEIYTEIVPEIEILTEYRQMEIMIGFADAYFKFKMYSEIRQVNGETMWDDLKKIAAGLKLAVKNYFEMD